MPLDRRESYRQPPKILLRIRLDSDALTRSCFTGLRSLRKPEHDVFLERLLGIRSKSGNWTDPRGDPIDLRATKVNLG